MVNEMDLFSEKCFTVAMVLTLICVLEVVSKDYCSITCNEEQHTMCKYVVPSKTCGAIEQLYTRKFAREMLDYHNDLRNTLANGTVLDINLSSASNMRQMKWDQELAVIANRWILQCIVGHDSCRDTADEKVGQNIAFINMVETHPEDAIYEWYQEIYKVQSTDIKSFVDTKHEISNISQMIWHSTTKVGCSVIAFKDEKMYFVACNYSPKGNLAGQPIYMEGPPCQNCPPGTNCVKNHQYRFLCIHKTDINSIEDFVLPPDKSRSSRVDSLLLLLMQCFLVQSV